MRIDPNATWRLLEERLAVEPNEKFRHYLDTVVRHMKFECLDDVEGVLSTVAPDARYDFYDAGVGPYLVLSGHREIGDWYHSQVDRRLHFEFTLDRLMVDDRCLLTEGVNKAALYGRWVQDVMGVGVDDPDALYYSEGRSLVVWPFRSDGLLSGEVVYRAWNQPPEQIARQKMSRSDVLAYRAEPSAVLMGGQSQASVLK